MIETINAMFGDTLWIYTAIAGALIGAAFLAWFKGTRAGLWCYSIFDRTLDFLVERWGWTWLQEPEDVGTGVAMLITPVSLIAYGMIAYGAWTISKSE